MCTRISINIRRMFPPLLMTESLNSIKTNVLNVTRHTTSQSIDRIGAFDNRCPAIFMHNPNDIWTHSSVHTCGRVELIWMKNSMHACLQMKCKHGIRNKKFEASAGVRRTHGSVFRIGKTSKCVVMKISHSFDGWTLDHWTFRVISFYMWIILIWYHINTRSVHVFRPMFKNVQECSRMVLSMEICRTCGFGSFQVRLSWRFGVLRR